MRWGRGWMMKVSPDGKMEPIATGQKSPSGFEYDVDGEVFYGENQGDKVPLAMLKNNVPPADHTSHSAPHHPAPVTNTLRQSSTAATPSAKRMTSMPTSWSNGPDQTFVVGTKPGLKFDVENLEVKAGNKVKLTFNNNDDMLHNLVVVKPGMAVRVG